MVQQKAHPMHIQQQTLAYSLFDVFINHEH